jgi:predicted amidohydrolase
MQNLSVTLIQDDLAWEDPEANRRHFAALLERERPATDLIVLPEMFTTGFSMTAGALAEAPGGPTEHWMRDLARQFDCAVCGSLVVRDGGDVFNRFLLVTTEGSTHYDKRHLFRMAGEAESYAPGERRVVATWRDWRIKLEVCYDLRFPVFARNRGDYDLLLNVASWPAPRVAHWQALLRARAIENQACVIGVNRTGRDGNDVDYPGSSLAFDAQGECLADLGSGPACATVVLEGDALEDYRKRFPFLRDADAFTLG